MEDIFGVVTDSFWDGVDSSSGLIVSRLTSSSESGAAI